jgi:hypothetical protein
LQDASSQQVKAGLIPGSLAEEGVCMRYLMDARIDILLADVYRTVTSAPLLHNPFGKVMSMVRCSACAMEISQLDTQALVGKLSNRLSKIGPPGGFVYAGAFETMGCVHVALHCRSLTGSELLLNLGTFLP